MQVINTIVQMQYRHEGVSHELFTYVAMVVSNHAGCTLLANFVMLVDYALTDYSTI